MNKKEDNIYKKRAKFCKNAAENEYCAGDFGITGGAPCKKKDGNSYFCRHFDKI